MLGIFQLTFFSLCFLLSFSWAHALQLTCGSAIPVLCHIWAELAAPYRENRVILKGNIFCRRQISIFFSPLLESWSIEVKSQPSGLPLGGVTTPTFTSVFRFTHGEMNVFQSEICYLIGCLFFILLLVRWLVTLVKDWETSASDLGLGQIRWIKCPWQTRWEKWQANLQSIATDSRNSCFPSSPFHSLFETILAKVEEIVGCPLTYIALFSTCILLLFRLFLN